MKEETAANSEDEISIIDLFAILWRRKKLIIWVTVAGMIGAVFFSIISLSLPPETSPLPNIYSPTALMLINNQAAQGGGSGLSSMLGNMEGLAALAGINMSGSVNYSELAVFLTGTNSFLDAVVDKFDLIKKYEIEKAPRTQSRILLKKILKIEYDNINGVLSISCSNADPIFAKDVVDFCANLLAKRFDELGLDKNKIEKENLEVNLANTFQEIFKLEEELRRLEQSAYNASISGRFQAIAIDTNRINLELKAQQEIYTQLKVQSELLKVTMASEKPVFQILEMAEIPDEKSGPSRGLLCIIVTFAAGFFAVFLAFILNFIENIKKDSQAMAKLRGTYEK